jgi:hypothetical protein
MPVTATKKSVKKAGRTLLVNNLKTEFNDNSFSDLKGLENKVITKSSQSAFLTFDTIDNAVSAFRNLRSQHDSLKVKFSYYRVFFKLSGMTDDMDYNTIKTSLSKVVEDTSKTNVLYCKFYKKDNKFLGCGDLTLDTMDGMNRLTGVKDGITFGVHTGNFYRYNNSKEEKSE